MSLPTISQYAESVSESFGLTRTLGELTPERDVYGQVRIRAGNNAAVFRVECGAGTLMLKCYIKKGRHSDKIYAYLAANPDPLLARVELLPDELYVYDDLGRGSFHDIVAAEWIEGTTLDTAIRLAAADGDKNALGALSAAFDRMALELLGREWAHGDLKPENIVVGRDSTMKLIDYDAMFVPPLAGCSATEIGTPGYQHPRRGENDFGKHTDDYPIALISLSLRALAMEPSLYGRYNNSDNIILYPHEIMAGFDRAYEEVLDLTAHGGRHLSYRLAMLLRSPSVALPTLAGLLNETERHIPASGTRSLSLFVENGLCGYRDAQGRTVIEAIYDDAFGFRNGMARVKSAGRDYLIDASGKEIAAIIGKKPVAAL